MTLDFIQGICFGVQKSKPNWLSMLTLDSISDIIDKTSSRKQFEDTLVKSINQAYKYLADLEFNDIDSDTAYMLRFDNNKKKWVVEIKDSKDAEVSLEEKSEIFKNEDVTKIIVQTTDLIFNTAADKYIKFVMPMIEAGNFLNVDEAKAEALKDFLEDRDLKTSFEKKTFVK